MLHDLLPRGEPAIAGVSILHGVYELYSLNFVFASVVPREFFAHIETEIAPFCPGREKRKTNLTQNRGRFDEIGTEEKLMLPKWEWDYSGARASVGGVLNGAGDGRLQSSTVLSGNARAARYVYARVSAEGRTRVLLVSSHKDIRRTISTFGVREAALVRLEGQSRLVLERYQRWVGNMYIYIYIYLFFERKSVGFCGGRPAPLSRV